MSNEQKEKIAHALSQWFEAGHSRFTLILTGDLAGSVLLANDCRPAAPLIVERRVISKQTGEIVERIERPLSIEALAADPHNGPALVEAVRSRLAGAIAPPPICPPVPRNLRA